MPRKSRQAEGEDKDDFSDLPNIGANFKQTEFSVGALIRAAFPRGTETRKVTEQVSGASGISRVEILTGAAEEVPPADFSWSVAPALPPDVFAVAGLLLDISGAAHHVIQGMPLGANWPRPLMVSPERLKQLMIAKDHWRKFGLQKGKFEAPPFVQDLWKTLWEEYRHEKVFILLDPEEKTPEWWEIVLCLLICADEACFQFGFQAVDKDKDPLERLYETDMALALKREERGEAVSDKRLGPEVLGAGRYTISTVPPDLVCVLPKSRTAQVGCTLRSLSLNLALLPPRGKARAIWHCPNSKRFELRKDTDPLNLLLIPHPFQLPPSSFVPTGDIQDEAAIGRWGWFKIDQAWKPKTDDSDSIEDAEAIIRFVKDLVKQATETCGPVHGIVFPELSLTHDTFSRLLSEITDATRKTECLSEVDLLIAGLRVDAHGKPGNFATGCIISRPMPATQIRPAKPLVRDAISNTQQKHHRWRLDQKQINSYGIGSSLTGGVSWWESLPLLSRSLNVFVFRRGSTIVPLICEDLARLEPVHELVRSIGPNIVVALLMDAAQVSSRWPGRYAMGLADDPGSSTLTLTSLGAVTRASDRVTEARHKSRSVGLWRDQTGDTRELILAEGASGIMLSLSCQRTTERTLDGRTDGSAARVWTFADQTPITLANPPPWAK